MTYTVTAEGQANDGQFTDRRGEVVAVSGSVIDIVFTQGELPAVFNAVEIEWDGPCPLIVEVHQHIDPHRVRGVALQETAGLKCGVGARDTGACAALGQR